MKKLAIVALAATLALVPVFAHADFPPPPPPPKVPAGVVGGSSSIATGIVIAYALRGKLGVWIIGKTEQRQSTFCEYAIWPAHNTCPPLTSQQRQYLELAWRYANLPSVQEQLLFAKASGASFSWPQSIAAMGAAIRRECRDFRYNNCRSV